MTAALPPHAPELSVIVPAHRCAAQLRRCLAALLASDLPRSTWELIVVDDASGDDTAEVAEAQADRVLRLTGRPAGPGGARNRGVQEARAPFVAFVDADVCVHPATLRGLRDALASGPRVAAVFGAYDAHPDAPGVVSRYRNLLHRWTHQRSAGAVATFWSGCGAVRRDVFLDAGGFDVVRYARPSIEDIELGYRITARGWTILLRPEIEATHLKRWTLGGMLRTDLFQRGIPWVELLLADERARAASTLNVGGTERLYTALAGVAALSLAAAVVLPPAVPLAVAAAAATVILAGNAPLFAYLRRLAGWRVALAAVPLRLLFYGLNVVALATGTLRHLLRRAAPRPVPA